MIVDNFQVAPEWRSLCRAGIVNTIAATGYYATDPLGAPTCVFFDHNSDSNCRPL